HAAQLLLTSADAPNAPLAVPVTLTVTRPGSIGGRVSDPAGQPIPEAAVTLRGARSRQAATDAAGAYAFEKLPPGDYTVEVTGTGFPLRRPQRWVGLVEGEQRSLDFDATSYVIRGRVTDEAGAPIARVIVRLYDATGVLLRQASTDGNGRYTFRRLGPGSYELRARRRPWRFQPAPQVARVRDLSLTRNFIGRR
ncbi:MAG TPA: carboxypeptidase-like regulatory domain-containing protein, partial [bacterium]